MTHIYRKLLILLCALIGTVCYAESAQIEPRILDQKPHIQGSFTQGLIIDEDEITESSGLYGQSYLIRYNAPDNRVIKKLPLANNYFGEGVTQLDDKIYLLTWKEQKVFVINAATFEIDKSLRYKGEGWGITHNGTHLITSDGSDKLSFREVKTFNVVKTITVHEGNQRWSQLNELEFAQGLIWANVWQGTMILAIDPTNGEVKGTVDLTDVVAVNNHTPYTSVLNGIAYDAKANAFWITGKLWPNRYLMKFDWSKPISEPKAAPASPTPALSK